MRTFGPTRDALLQRRLVQPQFAAELPIDHAAGHAREGIRPRIAHDQHAARRHVFTGEALQVGRRRADARRIVNRPALLGLFAASDFVNLKRLADDIFDRQPGIERAERLL